MGLKFPDGVGSGLKCTKSSNKRRLLLSPRWAKCTLISGSATVRRHIGLWPVLGLPRIASPRPLGVLSPGVTPGAFFRLTKTGPIFYKIFGRSTFGYKWTGFDKFAESRCGTVFIRDGRVHVKKGLWGVGGVREWPNPTVSTPFENVLAYNRGIE
jgi:hypothetical protein